MLDTSHVGNDNRSYTETPEAINANTHVDAVELSNDHNMAPLYITNASLSKRHIMLMTRWFLPFRDML